MTNPLCTRCHQPQAAYGPLAVTRQRKTQLLTLQFNEAGFLAKANTWDLLRPTQPFVGQGADYAQAA